jgi:hypothetical protein
MIGPSRMPDRRAHQPTHMTAKLHFCTAATRKNDDVLEEKLFYDAVGMIKQLGIM